MIKIHNCDEGRSSSLLKISLSEKEKKTKKNKLPRSPVSGNERKLFFFGLM
jgi:hypothetical protein